MINETVKNLPERLVRSDWRSMTEEEWIDFKQHKKAEKEIDENLLLIQYLEATEADFEDVKNFSDRKVKEAKEWKKSTLDCGIVER